MSDSLPLTNMLECVGTIKVFVNAHENADREPQETAARCWRSRRTDSAHVGCLRQECSHRQIITADIQVCRSARTRGLRQRSWGEGGGAPSPPHAHIKALKQPESKEQSWLACLQRRHHMTQPPPQPPNPKHLPPQR